MEQIITWIFDNFNFTLGSYYEIQTKVQTLKVFRKSSDGLGCAIRGLYSHGGALNRSASAFFSKLFHLENCTLRIFWLGKWFLLCIFAFMAALSYVRIWQHWRKSLKSSHRFECIFYINIQCKNVEI